MTLALARLGGTTPVAMPSRADRPRLWPVPLARQIFFGIGGSMLALREMLHLTGRGVQPGDWLVRHMVGMSAAYIATVSAFAVVTLTMLPRPVDFIGPTLIGTPLIAWLARHLTVALREGRTPGEILRGPAIWQRAGPAVPAL